ncbi:hypothetical protein Syun_026096 [Stephania yunnanensis]|uniref:Uncharacterized protein n=1 Tax=Stephania yunnanensis TaxID=152371 RepID=A0AAP0ESV9_9MAGN
MGNKIGKIEEVDLRALGDFEGKFLRVQLASRSEVLLYKNIDTIFTIGDGFKWRFTGFYDNLGKEDRHHSWETDRLRQVIEKEMLKVEGYVAIFRDYQRPYRKTATQIRTIWILPESLEETGLTCSAGVAPNRLLAKGFHTCVGTGGEKQTTEWYKEKGIEVEKVSSQSAHPNKSETGNLPTSSSETTRQSFPKNKDESEVEPGSLLINKEKSEVEPGSKDHVHGCTDLQEKTSLTDHGSGFASRSIPEIDNDIKKVAESNKDDQMGSSSNNDKMKFAYLEYPFTRR